MALLPPVPPLMLFIQPAGPWLLPLWPKTAGDSFLASCQGEEGDQAIAEAIAAPSHFVLKPQREGGGRWFPLSELLSEKGVSRLSPVPISTYYGHSPRLWAQSQALGDIRGTNTGPYLEQYPRTCCDQGLWSTREYD